MTRSSLAFVRITDREHQVFLLIGYHAFRHGRHASALDMQVILGKCVQI